ncbi:DNA polymerase III subunit delta [Phaeospirillum tilakii]|uniref:DNA-directed DNA polymerase n=1 Tax=Phaeospirillum tilakii TaxID=741673 RepID=A0ABW5CDI6_9PROT
MKIAPARIEALLRQPDPAFRAVLVFGPDQGLVRERVERLMRGVVPDLSDPFRVAELTGTHLRESPAALADEAAAIALGGGRRVVVLREAGDAHTAAVTAFLASARGDSLVVIEAGELGPRSSLRKLCEGADNAAALACYADDGAALEGVIQAELKAAGLVAEPEAMAWLTDHLGGDRRLTRSELAKLILYMGGPGRVRLEDAAACIGDSAARGLDDLTLATADGNHAVAQRVLDKLLHEGAQPVMVLRALARHFLRLHFAAGLIAQGKSVDQAMAALKPPVIFKAADRFRRQLARWPADRLGRALDLLCEAELDCKSTGLPAAAITSRAVMMIARAAARR